MRRGRRERDSGKPLRSQRSPRDHRSSSRESSARLMIRGRHPVLEALRRGIVQSLEIATAAHGSIIREIEELAHKLELPVRRSIFQGKEEREPDQGVRAIINSVTARRDLLKFAEDIDPTENPILLMLDGIEDPHNFGAILRSAFAAGVAGTVIRSRRQAPLNETVFKTSAGAAALLPVFEVTNLEQSIRKLKEMGWWCAAANRSPKSLEYHRFDWKRPLVLIVGAEGKGVSELLLKRADEEVSIEMDGQLDSLNVSVATGILLFEAKHHRVGEKE